MLPREHDDLIFEGRRAAMKCALPLPKRHPRVIHLSWEETARRHYTERVACPHFYFGRRHVGLWAIQEGRLYLQALYGEYQLLGEEPLPADWITGTLRIPQSFELLRPSWTPKVHEIDVDITIDGGVVRAFRVISNVTEWDYRAIPKLRFTRSVPDAFPGPGSGT